MERTFTQILGIVVAGLAVMGLFASGHLFGFINTDPLIDLIRIPLAIALLYAGFAANSQTMRSIVMFTGILYVGMAVLGLINSTLWGLLPSGLTGFDIIFHLITGIVAIVVARSVSPNLAASARGM